MSPTTATPTDSLTATFAALADPTRRAILARLGQGEATVNELAEPFTITVQAVSQHLKVLEKASLVSRTKRAQARPCRLEPAALDEALGWIERHRQLWENRSEQLDQHLRDLQDLASGRADTDPRDPRRPS